MRYVYLLQSEAFAGQRYVGITSDLRKRLTTTISLADKMRVAG